MAKDVIYISEAKAASDFAGPMARVRAGAEVIIENGRRPVVVCHRPDAQSEGSVLLRLGFGATGPVHHLCDGQLSAARWDVLLFRNAGFWVPITAGPI